MTTDPLSPELAQPLLDHLNSLYWQVSNLEIYIGLAWSAARGDIRETTDPNDAITLLLEDTHRRVWDLLNEFEQLRETFGIRFDREAWQAKTAD
jgi:hypothetical protein